jgi:hypothetical protein
MASSAKAVGQNDNKTPHGVTFEMIRWGVKSEEMFRLTLAHVLTECILSYILFIGNLTYLKCDVII